MPDTFVLDCSVAAKWVLPERDRAPALGWFERYASGEVLPIAPYILLAEFASLVAKRNRRKQISAEQAYEAFSLMTKCAPRLFDLRPRLFRALDLSLEYQLSLWDCVYLALAPEHHGPVLTADLRLFRAGRGRHPSVRLRALDPEIKPSIRWAEQDTLRQSSVIWLYQR
jgi:predicted nucleic acid-binding protein